MFPNLKIECGASQGFIVGVCWYRKCWPTYDETTPWAKFREQIVLWEEEELKELAAKFHNQAVEKTSMGDASIVILSWHYHQKGFHVEFLLGNLYIYCPIIIK